ncbi:MULTISPECIES: aminodeoxychorismate/anthranilate synthase component II [unclassified Leifsonia]|uniref:anthranilate synthase component II n=1 Tax=unclassified Leifsonia TaxID=2663824 RepID=UPI0008A783AB|nr:MULTISPECIES: aminodeoxychorismate/anthranilate synthase component II [unclassified Leifsonia]SEH73825.1 anthranilate synthase, component II [Leifsonia sp. CL154]SFL35393.1 anthranilate synthase, component II [Leifsonia sp. CL147]
MKVAVIDAFDSFVWIIKQYLDEAGAETTMLRSHAENPARLAELEPDCIVLGPGPGTPAASGHIEILEAHSQHIPVLGICLGHQAIAEFFGATVRPAEHLMHGKTSLVDHDGHGVFRGLPRPATVTRYHSLVVDEATIPECLVVTARSSDDNYVMGLRHKDRRIEAVQFHPESIGTQVGHRYFENYLKSLVVVDG